LQSDVKAKPIERWGRKANGSSGEDGWVAKQVTQFWFYESLTAPRPETGTEFAMLIIQTLQATAEGELFPLFRADYLNLRLGGFSDFLRKNFT
jgi:hypothetical protein